LRDKKIYINSQNAPQKAVHFALPKKTSPRVILERSEESRGGMLQKICTFEKIKGAIFINHYNRKARTQALFPLR
jgi:hypothetical protein